MKVQRCVWRRDPCGRAVEEEFLREEQKGEFCALVNGCEGKGTCLRSTEAADRRISGIPDTHHGMMCSIGARPSAHHDPESVAQVLSPHAPESVAQADPQKCDAGLQPALGPGPLPE